MVRDDLPQSYRDEDRRKLAEFQQRASGISEHEIVEALRMSRSLSASPDTVFLTQVSSNNAESSRRTESASTRTVS